MQNNSINNPHNKMNLHELSAINRSVVVDVDLWHQQ